MRLLYLLVDDTDPSPERLERRTAWGRGAVPGGWSFATESIDVGPAHYEESAVGHALAAPGILRAVHRRQDDYDAVIVACFGDPGVRAARVLARIPVVGPGEASLTLAGLVGRRFGVVTALESNVPETEHLIASVGAAGRCVGVEPLGVAPAAVLRDTAAVERTLAQVGGELRARGADVLVLGCMSFGFHPFAEALLRATGMPAVDPLRASVAALQSAVTLGLPLGGAAPALDRPAELVAYLEGLLPARAGVTS